MYRRASTRPAAVRATGAGHRRAMDGAPVLRAGSLNVDPGRRPVEHARTWFCSDRVEIVDEKSFR